MELLHWSTLRPAGPDNLAVIRFAQAVRVQNIRIFPKGSTLFQRCPEIVSETEPDAFFLEVFMNAQPEHTSDKPKNWPPNALAPTKLAYSGGLLDFRVAWNVQCSTRLLILKGPFQVLSVALYGNVLAEQHSSISEYELSPLPQDIGVRPLLASLDPSTHPDPTSVARSLLSLIPDDAAFPRPTIPLLLRLMFCLKALNEDWDAPGFPYVFADIQSLNARSWRLAVKREDDEEEPVLLSDDDDVMEPDVEDKSLRLDFLQRVASVTTRPASDETPREVFNQLASRIATAVRNEEHSPKEVAAVISQILKNCASQHPAFVLSIMAHVSLSSVFSSCEVLTEDVLACLCDAAANPDLAHALANVDFIALIKEFCQPSPPSSSSVPPSAEVDVTEPTEDTLRVDQPRSPSASPATLMSSLSTSPIVPSIVPQESPPFEIKVDVAPLVASDSQRRLAMDLLELLATHLLLEDGVSNIRAPFSVCMDTMFKSIGSSEVVVGAWMECLTWEGAGQEGEGSVESRVGQKLREAPVSPGVRPQSWGNALQRALSSKHRIREAALKWDGSGALSVKDDESVEFRLTHAQFIASVRAYIGVGCVMGVFAWADSCPDTACRERALEIIRLWQNVEGYKQIVKHFLLLPQMIKRLECNISGYKTPHSAGVLSEKILTALLSEPTTFTLHPAVVDNVLKLGKRDQDDDMSRTAEDEEAQKLGLTHITSQTLQEMHKVALVADDGLPGALDELKFFATEKREWDRAAASAESSPPSAKPNNGADMDVDKKEEAKGSAPGTDAVRKPISLRRLRTLRVAMSVVQRELDQIENEFNESLKESSLHRVLSILRREDGYGLCFTLGDLVETTAKDLADQLVLTANAEASSVGIHPPPFSTVTTEQLLLTNRDALFLMKAVMHVGLCPQMASRTIRTLIVSIADTYISANAILTNLGARTDRTGVEGSWWASGPDGDLGGTAGAGAGVWTAATALKKACTSFMHVLRHTEVASGQQTTVVMIKALLQAGEMCARGWRQRDPGTSLTQICHLIDELIPSAHEGDEEMETMQSDTSQDKPVNTSHKSEWATTVLPQTLTELQAFLRLVDLDNCLHLTRRLVAADGDMVGIGPWLVSEELQCTTSVMQLLKPRVDVLPDSPTRARHLLCLHKVGQTLQYIFALINDPSTSWIWDWLGPSGVPAVSTALKNFLEALIDCHLTSPLCLQLVRILSNASDTLNPDLNMGFIDFLFLLRNMQSSRPVPLDSQAILSRIKTLPDSFVNNPLMRRELGRLLLTYANPEPVLEKITLETSESIFIVLEWMLTQDPAFKTILGMSSTRYNRLCDRMYQLLPYSRSDVLHEMRSQFTIEEPPDGIPSSLQHLPTKVELSARDLEGLANPHHSERAKTPERHTPDVLGPIISPPTALLRSPAATGLTKTYLNNDFRQLRTAPTSRQNTSRLPSMHVDVGIVRTVD